MPPKNHSSDPSLALANEIGTGVKHLLCALAALAIFFVVSSGARADETPAAPTLLVFGDSLSAAYGINESEGWVTLLETRLAERGIAGDVSNASVSGETTTGGR